MALGLFALGVAVAAGRRRALLGGSLGFVGTMILLGLGLAIFRTTYVESTPAGVLTPDTAGHVFDTLVRFLRTGVRSVAVFGLLLALVAFLSGPSSAAQRTRGVMSGGIGKLRGDAEAAGMNTGRFGAWLHAHRPAMRVSAVVAAGLVLLFWARPDAWVVVGVAVVAALVVAVIEFLAAPLPPDGVVLSGKGLRSRADEAGAHERARLGGGKCTLEGEVGSLIVAEGTQGKRCKHLPRHLAPGSAVVQPVED